MTEDEVLAIARAGAAAGCREALFTLGDKPELRYKVAREELRALGCETTLEYLERCARLVLEETGLLPHLNPGVMTRAELEALRPVSASMGIMLETTAERLGAKGGPHWASPDKVPARRLETIRLAGELAIPFTSGILIGIGETREERIDALLALRALGEEHGTSAGGHRPELPREARHAHGVAPRAVARRPPLDDRRRADPARPDLARAGAAEPRLRRLPAPARRRHRRLGRRLAGDDRPRQPGGAVARDRATRARRRARAGSSSRRGSRVYPEYVADLDRWVDPGVAAVRAPRRRRDGLARDDAWAPGEPGDVPVRRPRRRARRSSSTGDELGEDEITRLLEARGEEAAARLSPPPTGCAARSAATRSPTSSRGTSSTRTSATSAAASARSRRGSSPRTCAARRTSSRSTRSCAAREEAWERGATEVCLQGGIHPAFTGDYYARRRARDQGRRARDPRARVLGARGLAGRGDARPLARGVPLAPARPRARVAARHGGRGPRRRGAPRRSARTR